jgi:hypothetical protein
MVKRHNVSSDDYGNLAQSSMPSILSVLMVLHSQRLEATGGGGYAGNDFNSSAHCQGYFLGSMGPDG